MMSCDAQVGLAKNEVVRNTYIRDYSIDHPACERMHTMSDRDIESELLYTVGTHKKLCIDKRPAFSDGSWKEQFQLLLGAPAIEVTPHTVIHTSFDQWTKAKSNTRI
jgi:hypothetical protein